MTLSSPSNKRLAEIVSRGDRVAKDLMRVEERFSSKMLETVRAAHTELERSQIDVAFVGSFSSGKSALINALLESPILPEGRGVVTNRPVWIGPGSSRAVGWIDRSGFHRYRTAVSDIATWIRENQDQDPHSVDAVQVSGILQAVKRWFNWSSEDAGNSVRDPTSRISGSQRWLKVDLESWPLGAGVRLLDTPGFNSETQIHRQMALDALSEAEVAVIVIEPRGMSADVRRFIADHVVGRIPSVAFVLNQLDLVDGEDFHDLIRICRKQVSQDLGLRAAPVIACSARGIVDTETGLDGWRPVRSWLDDLAQHHVQKLVAKKVLDNIRQVVEPIQIEISKEEQRVAEAQRIVAQELSAKDSTSVESVKARHLSELEAVLNSQQQRIVTAMRAVGSRTLSSLNTWLSQPASNITDQDTVKQRLESDFSRLGSELVSELQNAGREMDSRVSATLVEFWNEMKRREGKVKAILPTSTSLGVSGAVNTNSGRITFNAPSVGDLPNDGGSTLGGAAIGAYYGSVFPGIGTVVGGLIGGFLGAMFGNAREKAKKQIYDVADPAIDKAVENALQELVKTRLEQVERAGGEAERMKRAYERYLEGVNTDLRSRLRELSSRSDRLKLVRVSVDPWKSEIESFLGSLD